MRDMSDALRDRRGRFTTLEKEGYGGSKWSGRLAYEIANMSYFSRLIVEPTAEVGSDAVPFDLCAVLPREQRQVEQ